MNKKNLDLLNHFANNNSIALGGNVGIEVTEHSRIFYPKDEEVSCSMKYEDVNLLGDFVRGAELFLYHLEREGYVIQKRRKNGVKTKRKNK